MVAHQLALFRQRNVEHQFAAAALAYPVYTIQQCGWLQPERLTDERIKYFWSLLISKITSASDDETAASEAIQAAMQSGIYPDVNVWQQTLGTSPMPQAFAGEIARRDYIVRATEKSARLTGALLNFDDRTAKQIIGDLAALAITGAMQLPNAEAIHDRFEYELEKERRNVKTGIAKIDAAIGGLERQTLTIMAARPSMGKTAIAWQIARNAAHQEENADVYSLEMSAVSLWARAACANVGVTWRDVRADRVSAADKKHLAEQSRILAQRYGPHLRIVDSPQTTDTIWQTVAETRPDLVVIDHLRYLKDEHRNEVKRQGIITERLKDMAKAHNCAVLLCAQLSRAVEMRQDKRPMLSDLRDSGEIEENADVVLMLYRDDYYNPPVVPDPRSATEIWVRKFRDGPQNIQINLQFNKAAEWFESEL